MQSPAMPAAGAAGEVPSVAAAASSTSAAMDTSRDVAVAAETILGGGGGGEMVPLAPSAPLVLEFPRLVSSLLERVAAGGFEGRSLGALFAHQEWAEKLRRREVALATRTPVSTAGDARLDPFVRFHLVRLLRERRREVAFYCKQPQIPPAPIALDAAAAANPGVAAAAALPTAHELATDPAAQLAYIRSLCATLRAQQAVNPLVALSGGVAPVIISEQSLLDESLSGRGDRWAFSSQGLLHMSSLNRFQLLPQTLDVMNPDELHTLSTSIVLVASFARRCRFLGVTEEDLANLRSFSMPGAKAAAAALPPAVAAANLGAPFLMFNLLETIGKFSVQSLVSTAAARSVRGGEQTVEQLLAATLGVASPHAPPSSGTAAPSNNAGLLQTHLGKILHLSSGNAYRFLMVLQCRGMITPVKIIDETGVHLGAGWRWFLTHYSPSLHAAARGAATMSGDTPFASLGSLTADTPLQAFQASIHQLYQYYRNAPWKMLRTKLKVQKELEWAKIKKQFAGTAGLSEDVGMPSDEDEDEKPAKKGDAEGGESKWAAPSVFQQLNMCFGDTAHASGPPVGFVLNSSLTHQIYRLLVARGVQGTTTVDMRRHFDSYVSMKLLHAHVQVLLRHFEVKSIADQTGRSMIFRFFTKEDFELFKANHDVGDAAQPVAPQPKENSKRDSRSLASAAAQGMGLAAPTPSRRAKSATVPRSGAKAKSDAKVELVVPPSLLYTDAPIDAATPAASSTLATSAAVVAAALAAASATPSSAAASVPFPSLPAFPALQPLLDQPMGIARPIGTAIGDLPLPVSLRTPADSKASVARPTFRTIQREGWTIDALLAAPLHIIRTSDLHRIIAEREAALPVALDKKGGEKKAPVVDKKSCARLWNRLIAAGQLQQLTISVPQAVMSGFKTVDLLALPSVNFADPTVKEQAINVAKQSLQDQKRPRAKKSLVPEMPHTPSAAVAAAINALNDVPKEEPNMMTDIASAPPSAYKTPKKRAPRTMKPKESESDEEEPDEDDDYERTKEPFYPLSHGLIRPRVARMRWLLERLWTVYSTADPAVRRLRTRKTDPHETDEKKSSTDAAASTTPTASSDLHSNVLAAAAAATAGSTSAFVLSDVSPVVPLPPVVGPPRSLNMTHLISHIHLRDWLSLVGVHEDDFKSDFEASILLGSPANFERSVTDPTIAPWCHRMLNQMRSAKLTRLRMTFRLAEELGIITEAQRATSDDEPVGAGLGYFILEPRFTLVGRECDLTTAEGRDDMFRRLREACLRAHQAKITQQDQLEAQANPALPILPALESSFDIARSADTSTAAASPAPSSGSGLRRGRGGRAGASVAFLSAEPGSSAAILAQFPPQSFADIYRKAHWVMGKTCDPAVVDIIGHMSPPIGQPPLSSASITALRKRHFKHVNRTILSCYIACHRYPFVRESFERLTLLDSGTRAMFPHAGRLVVSAKKRTATSGGEYTQAQLAAMLGTTLVPTRATLASPEPRPLRKVTGSTPGLAKVVPLLRLQSVVQPRVRPPRFDPDTEQPIAMQGVPDDDHIPQELGVPFRRSTSHEAQPIDLDEDDDEEEPPTASTTSTPSLKRKRPKLTRVRWTPDEDQNLIQVFNEWFLQYYAPSRDDTGAAHPRMGPTGPLTAAAAAAAPPAPVIPNINSFAAGRMRHRDSNACRRRLDVLRSKGLLPVLISAGPAGVASHRQLSMQHLRVSVHGRPLSVSLLHFLQMLFSHPSDRPFLTEVATKIVSNFTDHDIDTVLKALRLDKWVTQMKYADNQTGRSWKFSAGWHDVLKPLWIAPDVFRDNRAWIEPWMGKARVTDIAPKKTEVHLGDLHVGGGETSATEPHSITLDMHVRGGEVAALFQLLQAGEVCLNPRVQEVSEEEHNVTVDVQSVPQLHSWMDRMDVPPPPKSLPPLTLAAAQADASAAIKLSSNFFSSHLQQPWSSLIKLDLADGPLSLSEQFLTPRGPAPADDEDADVAMEDVSEVVPAVIAQSSTTEWLDTPSVISAQEQLAVLVHAAGAVGVEWSDLQTRFLIQTGDVPVPAALPGAPVSLTAESSLFEKALARALSCLSLIRVMVHDTQERFVHEAFSHMWVLPTFNEALDADFKNTALLPHPWRGVNGEVNGERLQSFLDAIMSHLLSHPGMTPAALQRQLPVLAPSELEHCLQHLRMEDKITESRVPVETASLFSQPFAWDGDKKRKRRKTAPFDEPPTMQRHLFPTPRAFAL